MATEKRLIDLDKIRPMDFPSVEMDGLDVVRYLNTLPTVDAVEVVRCKDCEHRYLNKHGETCCEIWAHNRDTVVIDYDFCSYGKRK